MLSKEAILDTIKYISSNYDDEYYYVRLETFNNIAEIFQRQSDNIFDAFTHIIINNKKIYRSDNHPYSKLCIKIYDDDPYPMYIEILTDEERTIKNIIE